MMIKNKTLKAAIMNRSIIDAKLAIEINKYLSKEKDMLIKIGMLVLLKFQLASIYLPRMLYEILEVS